MSHAAFTLMVLEFMCRPSSRAGLHVCAAVVSTGDPEDFSLVAGQGGVVVLANDPLLNLRGEARIWKKN